MAREAKVLITSSNNIGAGIKSAVKDLTSLESNAVRIGKSIQSAFSVLAIVAAAKQVVSFGADCVTAFGEAERAMAQLKTALGGNDQAFSRMNDFIAQMGTKTLASKDEVEALVAELASLGKSEADIKKLTEASVALSNVTGQSLDSAFKALNGTYVGTTKELKKLLPEIGTLTAEQLAAGGAVDLLTEKFGTISDSMAGGILQSTKNLSDAWGDMREEMGRGWAEAFKPMTDALTAALNKASSMMATANISKKIDSMVGGILGGGDVAGLRSLRAEVGQEAFATAVDSYLKGTLGGLNANKAMVAEINKLAAMPDTVKLEDPRGYSEKPGTFDVGDKPGAPADAPPAGAIATAIDETFQGWNWESTFAPMVDAESLAFYDAAISVNEYAGGLENASKTMEGLSKTSESTKSAFEIGWGNALASVAAQFQTWSDFVGSMVSLIADGLGTALNQVGVDLFNQSLSWEGLGISALKVLAQVLNGIGAQLLGLAAVKLLMFDWVGAGIATAAAAAAFIAAGVSSALADSMQTNLATPTTLAETTPATSGGGYSGGSSSGASYSGSQAITFNFYNQGNVVGQGGLEELAAIIQGILQRNARYA